MPAAAWCGSNRTAAITVIADSYQGKRLNSPNDVVVKSDGSIWFTDPPFGTYAFYEGNKCEAELPHTNVYRVDGQTGAITCVADDMDHPNGLAFSPGREASSTSSKAAASRATSSPMTWSAGRSCEAPGLHRLPAGRDAGRLPRRCRRQSLVRLGHDRRI